MEDFRYVDDDEHVIWLATEFVQPIFFWRYLRRQKLPISMLQLRNGVGTDLGGDSEDEGDLEVIFLHSKACVGKLVKDLECLDDAESICPLGYTATRKCPSLAEIRVYLLYIRWK